ncbi:MAG: hypothetical protein HYZ74_03675 [Elusimicrobia bacterium]|nr:hypothetical protein [Elusimicrobiota bacterium]
MRYAILAVLLGAGAPARASEAGKVGVGFILGVPFGVTGKYWLDDRYAAQSAIGVSDGDLTVNADMVRNFEGVLPRKRAGRLPLYAGLGFKLKAESQTFFGVRFVGGISLFHSKEPIEFFAEIAPVLRVAPSEGGAFDGAVGVRRLF